MKNEGLLTALSCGLLPAPSTQAGSHGRADAHDVASSELARSENHHTEKDQIHSCKAGEGVQLGDLLLCQGAVDATPLHLRKHKQRTLPLALLAGANQGAECDHVPRYIKMGDFLCLCWATVSIPE